MAAAEDLRELLPGEEGLSRIALCPAVCSARSATRSVAVSKITRARRSGVGPDRGGASGGSVKIRLERDVLAEAVQWAARSLPVRPSVPILAGLLVRADADGVTLLQLRLRDLGQDHGQGRGHRRGPGPGLRPAAGRHLPQPARQAGRHHRRRHPRRAGLRQCPVHPADPAGRGLPVAADRCPRPPAPCRATSSPRPWPRSWWPPAATSCCRCSPGSGWRSRARPISLLATDRYRMALQGAHLEPGHHPDLGDRPGAGQGAQRHGPVDDGRRGGHPEPGQRRHRRRHHRLRGSRRGRRAADHDPAAGRGVPQGPAHHEHRSR